MMAWGLVLLCCFVSVLGQDPYPYGYQGYYNPARQGLPRPYHPVDETPKPYSFQYDAPAIDGSSSRTETADGSGRVVGSYTLTDADGRQRLVEYTADETGFSANVQTNEPGTKSESPANVILNSAAPPPTYDAAPFRPPAERRLARPHADLYAPAPYAYDQYRRQRYVPGLARDYNLA